MAIVITRPVGVLGCNMSIIADPETLEAVIIDPGGDAEEIIQIITTHGFNIKQILITHAHFDHILSCNEIEKFTGAPICYNPLDKQLWLSLSLQCMVMGIKSRPRIKLPNNILSHGDPIPVRNGKVIHTPGHTQGSSCFYFEEDKIVFTGDTLFAGSIGRTDHPGGNFDQIVNSIKNYIFTLPDDTIVVPGHGEETTIGKEKIENQFVSEGFN